MAILAPYADVHKNASGVGDARPTAIQIIQDQNLEGKLDDKVIFVTGATSGIGVETVRALYQTGAKVFMSARTMAKGEPIAKQISTDPSRSVSVIEMTLDSLESVRKGVEALLEQSGGRLNVLINNAGIMGAPFSRTADGFESHFGTNHLGHFYLFQLLKPALLSSATPGSNSRVISVSSSGHRMTRAIRFHDLNWRNAKEGDDKGAHDDPDAFDGMTSGYAQSKLANIYFATELDRRYRARGVQGISVHPGSITTPLMKHIEGDERLKKIRVDPTYVRQQKTEEQGAASQVWAAVAKEWEGKEGRYVYDCQEGEPMDTTSKNLFVPGYGPWAYDEEAEKRLWVESLKLVGLEDDAS